ncbi:MAG TPA: AAA family ATPase [Cryptosporangiaceae bacterium]|nr:AAA family ATPase [Cryptosporangiaceae bacterium]
MTPSSVPTGTGSARLPSGNSTARIPTGVSAPPYRTNAALPAPTPEQAASFAAVHNAVLANVEQVIRGKTDVVRSALACLFAGGHLLIEDVPGVGKTSLAKALAASIDASWHRIQFTPDLLPSDITGVSLWNQQTREFEFRRGAVFANIVIGDEINRASPKTQSALLEVMEEQQVTVDAAAYPVPRPFMVVATQNPIDLEGTYRLPEAQLDRFLMRISVGYPDVAAEEDILTGRATHGGAPATLVPVAGLDAIRWMIAYTAAMHTAPGITRYVAELAAATRSRPELRLGASPRGSLALLRAAQARAAGEGRVFVIPDDIKAMAHPVLGHRILLTPDAEVRGVRVAEVLDGVLAAVAVPAPAGVR